jgi:hypothetical protein
MWVGSRVAADKMKEVSSEVTACEICLRTSFNSYGAVVNSTGMPQQQTRKTKAQKQAEELEEKKSGGPQPLSMPRGYVESSRQMATLILPLSTLRGYVESSRRLATPILPLSMT